MANEFVEAFFKRLRPAILQDYARAQWAHINGSGPQPDYRNYGIGEREAQAVRIRLAQSR